MKNKKVLIGFGGLIVIGILIIGLGIYKDYSKPVKGDIPEVIVANAIIEKGEIIEAEKLTKIVWGEYKDAYVVTELEEIVDKISSDNIYPNRLIDTRSLSEKDNFNSEGKDKIGVYIDSARSGGAKAGDVVDVYWVQGNNTGERGIKIASSVKVDKMINERGQESNINPKVAYLYIESIDTPNVIPGSYPGNANITLVKKDGNNINLYREDLELGDELEVEIEDVENINP